MIGELFSELEGIVSSFGETLVSIFTSAIKIIYDTDGGQFTPVGVLMLLALGTGLLIWGFNFIRSLIRVRRG